MFRDEFDTVIYSNQKVKRYWNPLTNLYSIWEAKDKLLLWRDVDYFYLMDKNDAYYGRFMRLIRFMNHENYLRTIAGETVYTNKDLLELLELQPNNRTAQKFIQFLYSKSIIRKDPLHKRVYVNPCYAMTQTKIHIDCYRVFREELIPKLTNRAIGNLEKHLKHLYAKTYKNMPLKPLN